MTATLLSVDPLLTANLVHNAKSGSGAVRLADPISHPSLTTFFVSVARSSMVSQDSDQFLSYYGSEDAGQTYVPTKPISVSTESLSSSEYSLDSISDHDQSAFERDLTTKERPGRSGARSEEGRDRRRIHFGHSDKPIDDTTSLQQRANEGANTLRSRRGLDSRVGDLKLASPSTQKTYLTPPSTAPVSGSSLTDSAERGSPLSGAADPRIKTSNHQRKSSRDVGVVGIVRRMTQKKRDDDNTLIYQKPRSSSPLPVGDVIEFNARKDAAVISKSYQSDTGNEGEHRAKVTTQPIAGHNSPLAASQRGSRPPSPDAAVQVSSTPLPASSHLVNFAPSFRFLTWAITAAPLSPPPHATYAVLPHSPTPPRPLRLQSPIPARRRGDMEAVTQPLQLPTSTNPLPNLPPTSIDNDATKSQRKTTVDQQECDTSPSV